MKQQMKLFRPAAIGAGALAAINANAALPQGVETAIQTFQTDGTQAVTLMIVAVVAIWGLRKIMRLFGG